MSFFFRRCLMDFASYAEAILRNTRIEVQYYVDTIRI